MKCQVMILIAAVVCSGCALPATITTRAGAARELVIETSDADFLYVRGAEEEPSEATVNRVARAEVADIDHPGNLWMGVGAGMAALAGACAWYLIAETDDNLGAVVVNFYAAMACISTTVAGVGILGMGFATWDESYRASRPREVPAEWRVAPMVTRDERGDMVMGAGT